MVKIRTKITFKMALNFMLCTLVIFIYSQFANLIGEYLASVFDYPTLDPNNVFIKPIIIHSIVAVFGTLAIYIISRVNYMDFKIKKQNEGLKLSQFTSLIFVMIVFSVATYLTPTLAIFRYNLNFEISTLEWFGILVLNCLVKPIATAFMYVSLPITSLSYVLFRKKYQRNTAEIIVSALIFATSLIVFSSTAPFVSVNLYVLVFGLFTGLLYANVFKNTSSIVYVIKTSLIVNLIPILVSVVFWLG